LTIIHVSLTVTIGLSECKWSRIRQALFSYNWSWHCADNYYI
jgi:hypothetical protein